MLLCLGQALKEVEAKHAIFRRVFLQQLHTALQTWLESHHSAVALKQRLKNFMYRVMGNQLASCWVLWRNLYAEELANLESLRASTQHMRNLALASCLGHWLEYCSDRKDVRDNVSSIFHRFENQKLADAFNTWLQAVRDLRREKNLKMKSLGKIVYQDLAAAWECLMDLVKEARRERRRMRHAVGRFLFQVQGTAWERWREEYKLTKAEKEVFRQAFLKIFNSRVVSFLSIWRQKAKAGRERREDRFKKLHHMLNRELSVGLNSWLEWSKQHKAHIECARHALGVLNNQGLAAAWRSWQEATLPAAERARMMQQIMVRMREQKLGDAWEAWEEYVKALYCDKARRSLLKFRTGGQGESVTLSYLKCWRTHRSRKRSEATGHQKLHLRRFRARREHLASQQAVITKAVDVLMARAGPSSEWKEWEDVVQASVELQGLIRFWGRLYRSCKMVAWRFFVEPCGEQCAKLAESLHHHAGPRYKSVLGKPSQEHWAYKFKQVKVVQRLSGALALISEGTVEALLDALELDDLRVQASDGDAKNFEVPEVPVPVPANTIRARVKKLGIQDKRAANLPGGVKALELTESIMKMCDDDLGDISQVY